MVLPISKKMRLHNSTRFFFALLAIFGLVVAFLCQNFDITLLSINNYGFYEFNPNKHNEFNFVTNKLWRYILNNVSSLVLIHILFQDNRFSKAVALIQLLILIVLFPLFCYLAFSDLTILKHVYQKLNIILLNPVIPFILGVSNYFKYKKL